MLTIESTGGFVAGINGAVLFALLIGLGAYLGWHWGFRSFLTVTLASIIGYFVFVSGGELILNYINNIYANLPRIFALLTGGDPVAASRLDPITVPFALPLALRITFFIVTVALGVYFNKQPWHSTDLKKPYMREFGIFTGGLTALIWTSAASVFWQDYIGEAGTAPAGPFGVMNGLVGILPDVRTFVPFFMLAFVLFLIIVIVTKLPTLFKP